MSDDHHHKWKVLPGTNDRLQCSLNGCNTVSDIDTVLTNTASEAQHSAKVQLLGDQLYKRVLKKQAHDEAYAWMMNNSPENIKVENAQEVLL